MTEWLNWLTDWFRPNLCAFHYAMLSLFMQTQKHLQQGLAPLWAFLVFLCLFIQSCLTLCNHMDCSPPGFSVRGISQARILEWVAISFSNWCLQHFLKLTPYPGCFRFWVSQTNNNIDRIVGTQRRVRNEIFHAISINKDVTVIRDSHPPAWAGKP